MWDKIRKRFTENKTFLSLLALTIVVLAASLFLPDQRPRRIRNELVRMGYNVEHVEFEFVKRITYQEWVFQSSELIFFDENYVDHWLLIRRTRGVTWPRMSVVYYVESYAL